VLSERGGDEHGVSIHEGCRESALDKILIKLSLLVSRSSTSLASLKAHTDGGIGLVPSCAKNLSESSGRKLNPFMSKN